MDSSLLILLKLLLSAFLGIVIGIERELKHKPLGLKTSVIISVTSCLLTIVSIEAAFMYAETSTNNRTDPMRLAAQIVSGIGFLGAGVILRRNNDVISGLTTAAIIWSAAGIGIAVGSGFYYEAALGAGLILFSVQVLPYLITRIGVKKLQGKEMKIRLFLEDPELMTTIIARLKREDMVVKNLWIKDTDKQRVQIDVRLVVYDHVYITDIYHMVHDIKGVVRVEIDS
ncbi:MgtC/SapB family protein [Brevibacillus daliensis]|uniref:MgtC/SapB family protein n=1 Tax=Brevibacillus daliensis TaxID=2892995 RepID=UPI001E5E6259|nr:MgtC/SapB family protein [Brevibacillus daliensis]